MKTVAICALLFGLAAAIAGVVLVGVRAARTKKMDKTATFVLIACAAFAVMSAVNLFLVLKFL